MTARPLPRFSYVRHSMKFLAVLGSLSFVLLILLAFPAVSSAPTVAQCTPSGSDCAIPEEVQLRFPDGFIAISGDAVLAPTLNSNLAAVSDVWHIDNDFIDTGLGTGKGPTAKTYGKAENKRLTGKAQTDGSLAPGNGRT